MPSMSLIKSDARHLVKEFLYAMYYGRKEPVLKSRIAVSKIKSLIRKRGLALNEAGRPTWFYTAYERGDSDPLTNHTLSFVCNEVPKNSDILVTGCGTGIMLFFLMDQGFKNVEGFDYLNECVLVANDIAKLGGYNTRIWQDDGFKPTLDKEYDLITAMHWVFSAWMGNYGNDNVSIEEAKSSETREKLLVEFLSRYAPHLHADGMMIVELIDAVADYRIPLDVGPQGTPLPLPTIYPVRHTPEQVFKCAERCGLRVASYDMSCSYGYQPRTSYKIKKR